MAELLLHFGHPQSTAAINRRMAAVGPARRLKGFELTLATRDGLFYCDITTPVGETSEAMAPSGVVIVETITAISSVLIPFAGAGLTKYRLVCIYLPWVEDPLQAPEYVAVLPEDYDPTAHIVLGVIKVIESTSQTLHPVEYNPNAFPTEAVGGGVGVIQRVAVSTNRIVCLPGESSADIRFSFVVPFGASRFRQPTGEQPVEHAVIKIWGWAYGASAAPNDVVRLSYILNRVGDRVQRGGLSSAIDSPLTSLFPGPPGTPTPLMIAEIDISTNAGIWPNELDDWFAGDRLDVLMNREGGLDTYPYEISIEAVELEVVQRTLGALS